MSKRKEVSKRISFGIIFIPIYYFVIYPFLFGTLLVVGSIKALYTLVTGAKPSIKIPLVEELWDWTSQNVDWVIFGRGEFKLTPF